MRDDATDAHTRAVASFYINACILSSFISLKAIVRVLIFVVELTLACETFAYIRSKVRLIYPL